MIDRWRWLALPFCALALTMGIRGAFGVYVLPWEAEFASTRAEIASVSSLSFLVYGLGNVVAGVAAERLGVGAVTAASLSLVALGLLGSAASAGLGWLYLFYGLVASAGFAGASHVTASVAVRQRFPEGRRSFALSVVVAGMCAGQMVVVPAQVLAVGRWGWRPVLAALAGVAVGLAVAAGASWKSWGGSPSPRTASGPESARGAGALLRDFWFWVFLAPYLVCGFTDSGLVDNHLVPYARSLGASEATVAGALSVLAVSNLAGTVAAGYLADRWGRARVLGGLYALRAASLLLLVTGSVGRLWAFAPLFGATHFATIAPTNTLALTLFHASAPGLAVGLASLAHQVGAAAGALVGGLAFDRLGSYEPAFLSAVALLVASAAAMEWIHRARRSGLRWSTHGT
ncbi:MAG: MFS transporter [Armatimonadota bacterium]|nr:MFS transporter [Armatimonadota bacterium]MDR5676438.1 MFS transporter [Armatimonadota bacterium]MDR5689416.1 MFS transporter [Armatimonadota bacterium]MDR7387706.1 MFS transporter [Armatimonadota bacterium]MDR7389134.1 MFS transporter [Armatimonadota bacterium]